MGSKIAGMSHNDVKRQVAKEIGCDDCIDSHNQNNMAKCNNTLIHSVCTGTSPDFQWDSLHYFADMTFLQCFPSASARETHLHGIQDTSITHNSSKSC